MAIAQSIGHPFIHIGVNCDGCRKSPIRGYRFKCQRRSDHDLCAECFHRQEQHEQQSFLKIERANGCRPFHIHYIECDGCGAAPIEGPRYHHKSQSDYDLCATCFVVATSPNNRGGERPTDFEIVEETAKNSNRSKHHPIFHFEVSCDECRVSPICGPRYNSTKNFRYDLCLICFDTLLVNGRITATQFRRIERPDVRTTVHVYVFSCNHCGATPICGPAYINNTKQNKILCLMCYLNIKPHKQDLYTRVEPPRQLNLPVSGGGVNVIRANSAGNMPMTQTNQQVVNNRQQLQMVARPNTAPAAGYQASLQPPMLVQQQQPLGTGERVMIAAGGAIAREVSKGVMGLLLGGGQ